MRHDAPKPRVFSRALEMSVPLPSTIFPFTSDGVARWCEQDFLRRRPTHVRLFREYTALYIASESTERELRNRLAGGAGGDAVQWIRIAEQRRVDVEFAAETLAMSLDAILSGLRFQLFESDACKDHGPILQHGVTVDRALDAIGNYVRHGWEWFSHDYTSTWPNKRQTASIRPLAQLHTARPIVDSEDAYQEFTSISKPAAFVLDLLGEFQASGPAMEFATIESKVSHAAMASIEARLGPRFSQ